MAHNVKAIRRFYGPNKETVGFQGPKNVPEKNPIKALLRRLGFFGSHAATAAQRIAYVMCSFFATYYFYLIFITLPRALYS
jgi:hypothetical protein